MAGPYLNSLIPIVGGVAPTACAAMSSVLSPSATIRRLYQASAVVSSVMIFSLPPHTCERSTAGTVPCGSEKLRGNESACPALASVARRLAERVGPTDVERMKAARLSTAPAGRRARRPATPGSGSQLADGAMTQRRVRVSEKPSLKEQPSGANWAWLAVPPAVWEQITLPVGLLARQMIRVAYATIIFHHLFPNTIQTMNVIET